MMGIASDYLVGLGLSSCLGQCERQAEMFSELGPSCSQHNVLVMEGNWLFGIYLHIGCLIQR